MKRNEEFKPIKWHDFEIRKPIYLKHPQPSTYGKYDIVKWTHYTEPQTIKDVEIKDDEVIVKDKEVTENDKYCYSIGFLEYDFDEHGYNFESVGTRFLEDYEDGLCEWILDVIGTLLPKDTRLLESRS